jgi:hypothetical protein
VFDVEELARAVDARVLSLPVGCDPARAFGVRLRQGNDGAFVLVPFWSGVAREMPYGSSPPDGCVAIAMECRGWAAPMDGTEGVTRPSEHPERRRIHHTCLVYGAGSDVSVVRYEDDEPLIMRDGVGVVLDLLRACWSRRRENHSRELRKRRGGP